jgi:hypothetical protein
MVDIPTQCARCGANLTKRRTPRRDAYCSRDCREGRNFIGWALKGVCWHAILESHGKRRLACGEALHDGATVYAEQPRGADLCERIGCCNRRGP